MPELNAIGRITVNINIEEDNGRTLNANQMLDVTTETVKKNTTEYLLHEIVAGIVEDYNLANYKIEY